MEAHKLLAETHAKKGNIQAAINHYESKLHIAMDRSKKAASAVAALQLGLLYY